MNIEITTQIFAGRVQLVSSALVSDSGNKVLEAS